MNHIFKSSDCTKKNTELTYSTPAQTIPNQRHPWSMALFSACVCLCFLMTDTSRSSLGKRFNYQSRGLPITCAPHNLHGSTSLNRFPGHQNYGSNASEIPWPPLDDSYPTQLQGLKHLSSIPTRGQQSFFYDQRGDIFYSRTRNKHDLINQSVRCPHKSPSAMTEYCIDL